MAVILSLPTFAEVFEFTYEGKTLAYDVISEEEKTCQTHSGYEGKGFGSKSWPGNKVSGDLIIPSVASGYSVIKIGDNGFRDCYDLTSITIPNSVTDIANNAFENCKGLTSVTIPNSVKSIGDRAFWACNGLKELRIPKTVNYNDVGGYIENTVTTVTISFSMPNYLKIVDEDGNEIPLKDAATISGDFIYWWYEAYHSDYKYEDVVRISYLRPYQTVSVTLLGRKYEGETTDIDIDYKYIESYADMVVVRAVFNSESFKTDYYWSIGENHIYQTTIKIPYGSPNPSFTINGDHYHNCEWPSIVFPKPEFTECDAVATSPTKARLTAKCNLSTGATASIEWRRDDAPDNVKSKVEIVPLSTER